MNEESTVIDIPTESIGSRDGSHDKINHIKMMKISPDGKYLITYENKTITGWNVDWNVDDIECTQDNNIKADRNVDNIKCTQDNNVEVDRKRIIYHMCVSNEKILAYNYFDDNDRHFIEIVDMDDPSKEVKLHFEFDMIDV